MLAPLPARLLLPVVGLVLWLGPGGAEAAWTPAGVDLSRPRLMLRGADLDELRARLEREPYRQLFLRMDQRIREAEGFALDDHTIDAHRKKSSAAKNLAFRYALDRTVIDGEVVPFPTPEARRAAGARAAELLRNLFPRSRVAQDLSPPLGDWDRDISTSEELLQYAVAYDMLLGAGYDLGASGPEIARKLTDVASELYLNYVDPSTALSFPLLLWEGTDIHQNNHRAKTGSALIAAGVALAEQTPEPGDDPLGIRDPADWIALGHFELDSITRWVLTAGDGAYGEGPHYLNFSALNLHPLLRMWDQLVEGATYRADGLEYPSLWRHPLYHRSQRWALDITLPDGSLAPIDDSPVGEAFLFGTAPRPDDPALAAAFAWRWANAPEPYATLGNMDLSADAIVNHVDDVLPAPPPGSPTAFYVEGGTATLRSDWSEAAVTALVLGEHDTASSLGRGRDGLGRSPQSHEHEEPGGFLLHAFGERLLMDPGIVRFDIFNDLARPPAHNVILVEGIGPVWTLTATVNWEFDPAGRPPADGQSTLHGALDGDFLDAVSVVSEYGAVPARIERRFLFPDHRYLVVADGVHGGAPGVEYTWLFHGHGGEDSGGSFERTPSGARWSRPGARLDALFDVLETAPQLEDRVAEHEEPRGQRRRHRALWARAAGETLHGLSLLYPSPAEAAAPTLTRLELADAVGAVVDDAAEDRRVAAVRADPGLEAGLRVLPAAATGQRDAASDGALVLVDAHRDGALRLAWAEAATRLDYDGRTLLAGATPGALGWRPGPGRADAVMDNADAVVELTALDFEPAGVDGACALHRRGGRTFVELGRERRFSVRTAAGNARPAADPGPDRRSAVGDRIALTADASCDADGDPLTARWELVSAPRGSAWSLAPTDALETALGTDVPGPYRVRLVVRDPAGLESRPAELVVIAGDRCADGVDGDLDGRIDSDDPDCDAEPNRAPVALGEHYTLAAGEPFEADAAVLANDLDADGDAITAVAAEPPARGELLLLADGRFFYDPEPGFDGRDAFRYRARDARGAESEPVEVTLDVLARDAASLVLGALGGRAAPLEAAGPVADGGDFRIERDGRGRIVGVAGRGVLPAGEARGVTLELDLERVAGAVFEGRLAVRHFSLPGGALVREGVRVHVVADGQDGARGWWREARPAPGVSLTWSVRDASGP